MSDSSINVVFSVAVWAGFEFFIISFANLLLLVMQATEFSNLT